jgi:hypothetical protein
MTNVKFLLDENISPSIRDHLIRVEPTMVVLRVGDELAPKLGTRDEDILDWIHEHGYILVSRNRCTIPAHLRNHFNLGKHVPGILLIRRRITMRELIDELLLIGTRQTRKSTSIRFNTFHFRWR